MVEDRCNFEKRGNMKEIEKKDLSSWLDNLLNTM